jgi:DNA-binding PadR family transcriptional regulator
MAAALSYTSLFVLKAVAEGHRFGFDIMDATGLASGTVYPALRRLEAMRLVESSWEDDGRARAESRPRRRNYQLTRTGRLRLGDADARFRAVSRLFTKGSRA